jgi:Ca2+-transporting ATPase
MIKGFSTHQAEELLKQYGLNVLDAQKKKSIIKVFFEQFNNFLTILLLIAAIISLVIGKYVDGGLVLAIVILNAFFGLYQEKKAGEAIEALKKLTLSKVRVIRDGQEVEIDSRYLVPGDVVFIEEGVKVPADGKMIQTINLQINESTLTGESMPISKDVDDEIFMGTIVARGRGYMEVLHTGMQTKFGSIAANLAQIEETETPLQKKLTDLSKIIGFIGIGLAVVIFLIALYKGSGYFPSFLLAVSLAVAVVPEALPAIMTITLSIGVKEMANKKAVIRKLSAIEALGSTTLIATDKTGTLTANKMKVKEIFVGRKVYDHANIPSLYDNAFSKLILDGILCSTATLVYTHETNQFDVLGDPTEGALLFLANKAGLIPEKVRPQWHLEQEIPFDSESKKMTVKVRNEDEHFIFTKGAVESILPMCNMMIVGNKVQPLQADEIHEIDEVSDKWSAKGLRVLALAYKDINKTNSNMNKGFIFIGMVAIYDPPRPEVNEAIRKAADAGIKIVMITGDSRKTAESIGVAVGLLHKGDEILTGDQLDMYSDRELLKVLPQVRIFARVSPFHKARIVKLYQVLGEIVVVTGDGVNDSIALKQADVGVAMGVVGTDVARETADMIITDDNFATIVNAVEEGRNIIKNLKNAIKYLISGNIAEALALSLGMIIGLPQLFFPIQLLYTNLITDGIPALAMAFSPREGNTMKRPPDKKLQLLNKFDNWYILLVGLVGTALVLGTYFIYAGFGEGMARTAASCVVIFMQTFIFADIWISHGRVIKNFKKFKSFTFLFAFLLSFILQIFIVTIPGIADIFKVVTVSALHYIEFVLLSFIMLIGIFVVKFMLRFKER